AQCSQQIVRSSYAQPVEVPDDASGTGAVEHETQYVRAGGERNSALRHRRPVLPAAGTRHGERSRDVHAVDVHMEGPAGADGRYTHVERVDARRRNRHRVIQPLARIDPADVVALAGIRSRLDIDVDIPKYTAAVAGRRVAVRHVGAIVEPLRFDR